MKNVLYAWFDTEYSNLDLDTAVLLQVALIVTDPSLKRVLPVEEDVRLVVRLPEGVGVSPWVMENLPDLERRCRSDSAVAVAEVDARLSASVDLACRLSASGSNERPVLAGNSIHADWWLARRFLPGFLSRLHYRHLDVTALKLEWQRLGWNEFDKENAENVRKWFPEATIPAIENRHDAYYDVQASIAELAFYRTHLLVTDEVSAKESRGDVSDHRRTD